MAGPHLPLVPRACGCCGASVGGEHRLSAGPGPAVPTARSGCHLWARAGGTRRDRGESPVPRAPCPSQEEGGMS